MVLYEQNPQFAPEAYHQACGHEPFATGSGQRFRRLVFGGVVVAVGSPSLRFDPNELGKRCARFHFDRFSD